MYSISRVNSKNTDFIKLVEALDSYLATVDGDDHDFYHQFNGLDNLNNVVVLYINDTPTGCGAIKKLNDTDMEVKRMYVDPKSRGAGIAGNILKELESWAAELNYKNCILETGKRQVEAIGLYKKHGYTIIPNYGQYKSIDNSVCFFKGL